MAPRARFVLLAVLLALAAAAPASAAPTREELDARQEFVAGRYEKALDLFARLYAQTLHPTYLRNIGRCHQMLGEPDKAIASFRDYLRKARGVPVDERTEVEGYIKEMEDLKKARSTPPPREPEVKRLPEVKTLPEVQPLTIAATPPPPVESSPALYQRGWFWAVVGVVVLGGVAGGLAAAGVFSPGRDPTCAGGYTCK